MKIGAHHLRYLGWPYAGAIIAAVAFHLIGPEPSQGAVVAVGCVLILPFLPVQYAISQRKMGRREGFLLGLVGPAVTFLAAGTLFGAIIQK